MKKTPQNPDVVTKTWSRSVPAAVLCYTHTAWRGLRALTEHVLRRDRQDLASSCSYRSLLARPLLLHLLLRSPTNHS